MIRLREEKDLRGMGGEFRKMAKFARQNGLEIFKYLI